MAKRVAISIIQEISKELWFDLWIEPEYGFIWYLEKNGVRHFFRNTCLDINRAGATKICNDKGYTSLLLEKFWYPVAEGKTFFSEKFNSLIEAKNGPAEWLAYARSLGFPVIIKPNNASQGHWVRKIYTEAQYWKAIEEEWYERYRIERYYSGRDYRILVLDGEVMAAYERIPFSLEGDWISTIRALLERKKDTLRKEGRKLGIDITDQRILFNLERNNMHWDSVLETGVRLSLLDNANLSTGWDMYDVTHTLHEDFMRLAINATKDIGLTLCGVDIITEDATLPWVQNPHTIILEMNASPWLSHYHTLSEEAEIRTKNIYRKILILLDESRTFG